MYFTLQDNYTRSTCRSIQFDFENVHMESPGGIQPLLFICFLSVKMFYIKMLLINIMAPNLSMVEFCKCIQFVLFFNTF